MIRRDSGRSPNRADYDHGNESGEVPNMATPKSPFRLYYLTCEKWGKVTLAERRLKFSRFDDLNDPFELLSAHMGDQDARRFHKKLKAAVAQRYGLLCLS